MIGVVVQMIRVWGFPTSHGGVDYFLIGDRIRAFGTDDMGNDIDDIMPVEEFLDSVAEQSDYDEICRCIREEREAIL